MKHEEAESIRSLIYSANRIVLHQEEIKKLKGESFNIFSILKMDTYENETHSAFIGELLNPRGSHLLGNLFLKLFLSTIGYKGPLDPETASIILEKHIGSRDDQLKTGGRVDIYIADATGQSICIENKISAADQNVQIERYVNHNRVMNSVYYLTLNGDAASEGSKGELKEQHDYVCISYKHTITQWLDKCLKETAEQAILRESIRQYLILIKKLTNQLSDHKMAIEIENLIRCNYLAAKVLASNISNLEIKATHELLLDIEKLISLELKSGWEISVDNDLSQSWTGLRITRDEWNGMEVKLEGSKMPWGNNYYGIVAPETQYDRSVINERLSTVSILKTGFSRSKHWPYYKYILDLSSNEERTVLFDESRKAILVKDVAEKMIELARACEKPLEGVNCQN